MPQRLDRLGDRRSPSKVVALIRSMGRGRQGSFFALRGDYFTRRWSYRRLFTLITRFACLLQDAGIKKGDRVVIRGANSPALLVALLGTLNHGAVLVPLDDTTPPEAAGVIARQVGAGLMLAGEDSAPAVPEIPFIGLERLEERLGRYAAGAPTLPAVYADDVAEIVFTSGITAAPKGVLIRHANIAALFPAIRQVIVKLQPVFKILGSINFLALLPLSHLYGQLAQVFIPLMLQGSVVFAGSRSAAFLLETIKKEKITVAVCVPRILEVLRLYIINDVRRCGTEAVFWKKYRRMQNRHFILRYLQFFGLHRKLGLTFLGMVVGGARLDEEIYEFFRRLSFAVYHGYGLTEASPMVTFFDPFRDPPGSVGRVAAGQQVRIDTDGEILVKGPNVSEGYFQAPSGAESRLESGWLRTGDIGRLDRQGNLFVLGRKKDVIVTSDGRNVYPPQIEAVLNALPGVKDSAVVGIDKNGREEVAAVLLPAPGLASVARIVRRANALLPPSQRIKHAYLWPEPDFPRTALLKVKKREVAARIGLLTAPKQAPSHPALAGILGRQLKIEAADLNPDWRLGADLGLSSLDRMELGLELEKQFEVSIADGLLDEATTVGALADFLAGKKIAEREICMPRYQNLVIFNPLRFAVRYFILFAFLKIFCRLEVQGLENLQKIVPPVMFVANHRSHLDTLVIMKALPPRLRSRLVPAMKTDDFDAYFLPDGRHPLQRLLQCAGYLSLTLFLHVYPFSPASFRKSLAYTAELVEKKFCPLIFPEGQRAPSDRMLPFKEGIGRLAPATGAAVVPLRLKGTAEILPPGAIVPKRGRVTVTVGRACRFGAGDPKMVAGRLQEMMQNL